MKFEKLYDIMNGKMKLLIVTQKVDRDDDILGFFHEWLREFANRVDKLTVICLQKGEYKLPSNVSVYSLGKESGSSRLKYLSNFYRYIFRFRGDYDFVFVHMNPEYVILGSPFWKLLGKKIGLWYVHRAVDWKLRLASILTDLIFTASPESFRLHSSKVKITGHGINVDKFKPSGLTKNSNSIVSVGRIASVKNYEILIDAAKVLGDRRVDFEIKIVGMPVLESDVAYFNDLKKMVGDYRLSDRVIFTGKISHQRIMDVYSGSKVFVNLSDTGSLDKAVLEAMASGLLVLTSNEAFRNILDDRYVTNKDAMALADKLLMLINQEYDPNLREYVVENHNLKFLVGKILSSYA